MRRSALCLMFLPLALSACHSKTDDRLKALEDRLAKVEAATIAHNAVTVKPGDTGYGLLDTDFGRIAVAIADVQPSPTGTRLVLDFGNPTTARLTGMKARIDWGANEAAKTSDAPMAAPATSGVDFTAAEPLPAGSWHQYTIDLPGVAPAKLGWVRVSNFDSGNVDLLSQ